eukprot:108161_1
MDNIKLSRFAMWPYLLLLAATNAYTLPWSWDTIPLWLDFGLWDHNATLHNGSYLTEYQTKFLAKTYDIISIEKCLGNKVSQAFTEEIFYNISFNLRRYATSNETKILLYFNVPVCFCECYAITQSFCSNESVMFKDDYGNPLYLRNDKNHPYYDHSQPYVRTWWVNTVSTIIETALKQHIIVDGLFADGVASAHTIAANPNVSSSRAKAYSNGQMLLLDELRAAFAAINNDLFVIGNDITMYPFAPDHNLHVLPHVDGLLGDHYMAYEEVLANEDGAPINATDLLLWYNISKSIRNGDYGENKVLIMKGWIGPEVSPINSFGPSWPKKFYLPTPTTHSEVASVASELLQFPLAVYLCGIYDRYVYFTYTYFWGLEQGAVPCPDDPSSCDAPVGWYQEFMNKLGEPMHDGQMTNVYKCNRSFEYADVYVDLRDRKSAMIKWNALEA